MRRYELHDGFLYEDGMRKVNVSTFSIQAQAEILETLTTHIGSLTIETFGSCKQKQVFKIKGRPYLETTSAGTTVLYELCLFKKTPESFTCGR